ncbi:MAG TPA: S53 family peptidase [Bryobacteraceae bacterium]|nr:S53 family peptidase [Bryobacteraceae bacterium]
MITLNKGLLLLGGISAALGLFGLPGFAQNSFAISNNTPGFIRKAVDQGPVDPSTVISVTVWLKLHNEKQLDQLVQQQYQEGSGNYRQWIAQDQFNASYGPTAQEVNAVQNFLTAHGLSVLSVAENNMYVKVQGAVRDIAKAFHVQIDNFNLNGSPYRSNTGDPSVSHSSGAHIAAITGMDDYGFQPAFVRPSDAEGKPFPSRPLFSSTPDGVFFEGQCFQGVQTVTFAAGSTTATYTGNRYGSDINSGFGHFPPCGYSPSELQAAYNMNPLYGAGLNGAGETVVITDAFGSGTIQQDAQLFSQIYGLPAPNLQVMKGGGLFHNPHDVGWDVETTLDVEWAHAMAPGANIALVLADDHASLDEAINYAVVHHLGNTISNSWGSVEGLGNPAQFHRINRILQMAAAQGIDVNFATGDFGDFTPLVGFVTVNFPASSPFATGIGGTSLFLNPDNSIAFQTGWGNNLTKIANPIAQGSSPLNPPLNEGFNFGAGGGPSLTFARPAFQSGLSVPGNTRLVPDISLVADPFTGVEIIQTIGGQAFVEVIGGTSLATPMFSGLMAIAAQKAGHGLGQAAPLLYNLPAGAIADVTNLGSPNNVTGKINGTPISADQLAAPLGNTTSYVSALYNSPFSTSWFVITFGTDTSLTTGPGWDNVTGVGTPNGANFVAAIAP